MSGRLRSGSAMTRRRLLTTLASAAATTVTTSLKAPALSRSAQRPIVTHGVQSGDISTDSGMVWSRTDRPARMLIEAATTESFEEICYTSVVDALPETDFTAKALIDDLPPGQDIFYRLRFQDLSSPKVVSAPAVGRFRTAPFDRRSISFMWSGDTAGQGWGIDASRGGMRTYAAMLRNRPDFFVHCGDSIYADCTISAQQKLSNGEIWRNIVTEDKSKVATTLNDYRGNYKYNLLDANLRVFNAEVPIFAQWDNHEVMEDWWPGEVFDRRGYDVKSASLLAARGCRAFHEFMPLRYVPSEPGRIYRKISYGPLLDLFLLDMRSYRGSNDVHPDSRYGPDAYLLGPAQTAWLKRELKRSTATWKVIASDTPLGTIAGSLPGAAHTPVGRAIEIADLLSFMQRTAIHNTVWITADLHYTAAHYFDPNEAVFQDFEPFWEFVSGPIHAGTWTPRSQDPTFGPRVVFQSAASGEQGDNLAPCFGLQFFGRMAIDGATGLLTVTLKNVDNRALWSTDIEPGSAHL
ncbi:MAG TPA: alkaline phosphatase D family protein [Pseudolabrys sp.]|nr:alkaline phosphatase D family protein [Pseudolabrys sp.]